MKNHNPVTAIVTVCQLLSKEEANDADEAPAAYATPDGHALPELLNAEEAIALFESGDLLATDMQFLNNKARRAVTARLRGLGVKKARPRPWCMRDDDQRPLLVAEGTH